MSKESTNNLIVKLVLEQILADYLRSVEDVSRYHNIRCCKRTRTWSLSCAPFFDNQASLERVVAPLRKSVEEPTIGFNSIQSTPPSKHVRYFGDYELLERNRSRWKWEWCIKLAN